jgi:hypothetical protein
MVSDIASMVAAAAAWLACGYKLHHLRQRRDEAGASALRALVVVLAFSAVLATATPRFVGAFVDALAGISGVTRLLANVASMITCLAIVGWLLYLSQPKDRARRSLRIHVRVFFAVLVAVMVLFAVDHPPLTPGRNFTGSHTYLFLLYVTYAVLAQIRLSWQYAKVAEAPLIRLGLRTVAVSNVLGIGAIAIAVVYVADADLGLGLPGSMALFTYTYAVASLLFVLGMTLPAWGPRVGLERLWWRATRWHLQLLWDLVTEAYPGVVLDRELLAASPHAERLAAERLPVEIHDGWLHLRHYLTPHDKELIAEVARLHGLDEREHCARLAAAHLMVALQRRLEGREPVLGATPPVERLGSRYHRTLVADARFLSEVSRCLRSPFVREVMTVS